MYYEWVSEQWAWSIENACIGCSVNKNQHPNTLITSNKIHIEMQCLLSDRLILFCQWNFSQALRHTLYPSYTLLFMLNGIIISIFILHLLFCLLSFFSFFSFLFFLLRLFFGDFFYIQFIISISYSWLDANKNHVRHHTHAYTNNFVLFFLNFILFLFLCAFKLYSIQQLQKSVTWMAIQMENGNEKREMLWKKSSDEMNPPNIESKTIRTNHYSKRMGNCHRTR